MDGRSGEADRSRKGSSDLRRRKKKKNRRDGGDVAAFPWKASPRIKEGLGETKREKKYREGKRRKSVGRKSFSRLVCDAPFWNPSPRISTFDSVGLLGVRYALYFSFGRFLSLEDIRSCLPGYSSRLSTFLLFSPTRFIAWPLRL